MSGGWVTGIVESVALTSGSLGHQVTTIDGQRYATWLDFNKFKPMPGEEVEYLIRDPLPQLAIPCADVRKRSEDREGKS